MMAEVAVLEDDALRRRQIWPREKKVAWVHGIPNKQGSRSLPELHPQLRHTAQLSSSVPLWGLAR